MGGILLRYHRLLVTMFGDNKHTLWTLVFQAWDSYYNLLSQLPSFERAGTAEEEEEEEEE